MKVRLRDAQAHLLFDVHFPLDKALQSGNPTIHLFLAGVEHWLCHQTLFNRLTCGQLVHSGITGWVVRRLTRNVGAGNRACDLPHGGGGAD